MLCWEMAPWTDFDPAGTAVGKELPSGDTRLNNRNPKWLKWFCCDVVLHFCKEILQNGNRVVQALVAMIF